MGARRVNAGVVFVALERNYRSLQLSTPKRVAVTPVNMRFAKTNLSRRAGRAAKSREIVIALKSKQFDQLLVAQAIAPPHQSVTPEIALRAYADPVTLVRLI